MAAFAKERVMAASKKAPLQAGLRVRGSNSVSASARLLYDVFCGEAQQAGISQSRPVQSLIWVTP
jgi:hypothetical protein